MIFKTCDVVGKISFEKKSTKKIKTSENKYKCIIKSPEINNNLELYREINTKKKHSITILKRMRQIIFSATKTIRVTICRKII